MSATTTSTGVEADARQVRWAVRLWVVVLVFVAITVFRWWQVDVVPRDPGGMFLRTRVLVTTSLALGLALADAVRRAPPGARTPRGVLRALRDGWTRRRAGLVVAGFAAYHTTYFCYRQLKSWNAFRPIHDDALAAFDVSVFGTAPAALLHDALGVGIADRVLVAVYESFSSLVAVAVVAPLVLDPRLRRGAASIASFVWVWILGVASYYLIPSLGPFHQDPGTFAALPDDIVRQTQQTYLVQRSDLLADPGAHDAVAQIGAFASLHVAVACLILLIARSFGLRRTSWALGAYLATTCVATVYLGWHFVSDDLAGLVIAGAAFALGHLTVGVPLRAGRADR